MDTIESLFVFVRENTNATILIPVVVWIYFSRFKFVNTYNHDFNKFVNNLDELEITSRISVDEYQKRTLVRLLLYVAELNDLLRLIAASLSAILVFLLVSAAV